MRRENGTIRRTPSAFFFLAASLHVENRFCIAKVESEKEENIIYNELLVRGFNVDVGVVEHSERDENGKAVRKRLEVDFVCNRGNQRYYIQSAFAIPDNSKMQQQQKSLVNIGDSFKKIIVVKDRVKLWRNEEAEDHNSYYVLADCGIF